MTRFLITILAFFAAAKDAEMGRIIDWAKGLSNIWQYAFAVTVATLFTLIAAWAFGPAIIDICQWAGLY